MPESRLVSLPTEPMEGRSRNVGLGFPYDRCVPKASRSSRNRGDSAKKSHDTNDPPRDMCFFELLATVAGQLLQDQQKEESPIGKLAANSKIPIPSPVCREKEMQECIGTNDVDQIKDTEQPALKTEEKKLPDAAAAESAPVLHGPSATPCLNNSDPVMPQGFESKALMTPMKAYSSRKRKNSEANSSSNQKTSSNTAPTEVAIKSEPADQTVTPRQSQFPAMISVDNTSKMPPYCAVECIEENKMIGKQDLNHISPNQLDLLLCSSYPPPAESPPLVSSGSSEEIPFSDSAHVFESSRQISGTPNFYCTKGREDDCNSSETNIPKLVLPKSANSSYVKGLQSRKLPNNAANKRDGTGVYKRKRNQVKDEERSGKRTWRKAPKLMTDTEERMSGNPDGMNLETNQEKSTNIDKENITDNASPPAVTSPRTNPRKSTDSHVKVRIKSFMVPELMVDLPESATVANLKKAVMEAAMNLLGGGLCVRVLLQGKKVVDESESLHQVGIENGGKFDTLGFMLEPNPVPTSSIVEDAYLVLSHGSNQTSSRYPVMSKGSEMNIHNAHVGVPEIDANSSGTEMQSTTVSPSKNDNTLHESSNGAVVPGSCALVVHPNHVSQGQNGLAVVPYGQNQANAGMNKRRMRRPFTVSEVEVLVQAVEKLGTGRWRDVKLHAFPQAKHRTYVDLKDKWKTLVHTASIAPHQRRGEPVPQGLLDRVIQAHSYWTAQQAKQQSIEAKVF